MAATLTCLPYVCTNCFSVCCFHLLPFCFLFKEVLFLALLLWFLSSLFLDIKMLHHCDLRAFIYSGVEWEVLTFWSIAHLLSFHLRLYLPLGSFLPIIFYFYYSQHEKIQNLKEIKAHTRAILRHFRSAAMLHWAV